MNWRAKQSLEAGSKLVSGRRAFCFRNCVEEEEATLGLATSDVESTPDGKRQTRQRLLIRRKIRRQFPSQVRYGLVQCWLGKDKRGGGLLHAFHMNGKLLTRNRSASPNKSSKPQQLSCPEARDTYCPKTLGAPENRTTPSRLGYSAHTLFLLPATVPLK